MNRKAREKLRDEAAESAFRVPKRDWRGVSYSHLLPLGARFGNSVGFDGDHEVEDYEVGVVDDPTMKQGKYGIVSRGDDTLGPVVVSILGFAEMRDLKAELNEQWREKNPDQPPSLTLSKIRNLKAEALEMCHRVCGLEVSTVAFACVYLERLIIERIVTKANRRVTMVMIATERFGQNARASAPSRSFLHYSFFKACAYTSPNSRPRVWFSRSNSMSRFTSRAKFPRRPPREGFAIRASPCSWNALKANGRLHRTRSWARSSASLRASSFVFIARPQTWPTTSSAF